MSPELGLVAFGLAAVVIFPWMAGRLMRRWLPDGLRCTNCGLTKREHIPNPQSWSFPDCPPSATHRYWEPRPTDQWLRVAAWVWPLSIVVLSIWAVADFGLIRPAQALYRLGRGT